MVGDAGDDAAARPWRALPAARAAAAEGRIEEALALIGRRPPARMRPPVALLAGRCLARRPDPAAAIPYLLRAAAEDAPEGERAAALLLLARLRLGFGQQLLAVAHLRDLLQLRPGQSEALFLLARAWRELGWPDLALGAFARLGAAGGWWRRVAAEARQQIGGARQRARAGIAALRAGRTEALPDLVLALVGAGRVAAALRLMPRLGEPALRDWFAAMLELRREGPRPGLAARLRPSAGMPPVLRAEAVRLLLALGEPQAALAAMAPLPAGSLWVLRAQALLAAGRPDLLEAEAQAALAESPGRIEPARGLLTARLIGGRIALLRHVPAAPAPPLSLVQYWDRLVPPEDVRAAMDSWRDHHPGLVPVRFDDAAARDFLAAHHGAAGAAAFDGCAHPATRSDLLRLAFLAAHGGLWVDADERCRRALDGVLALVPRDGLMAVCSTEIPHYVHSFVLAALPGSALARAVQSAQLAGVTAALAAGQRVEPWSMTGPGLITRVALARAEPLLLLDTPFWRSFAEDAADLGYKREAGGDWREAG